MKKTNNLKEQMQPKMAQMPINGLSFTPDGKGNVTPSPIVTADNLKKAQVPTPAAAMAGAFGSSSRQSAPVQDEQEDQTEEMEETEEEEEPTSETIETNESTEKFKAALAEILGEEIATESLVNQLEAIFEAAVQEKVEAQMAKSMESLDEGVKTYLDNVTNTLVEKVDDYLDYVVEEWMQENAVAVEQGIKTQIAENFISGLKNLFENHYIDVPNEKYNALDELYANNVELQNTLNKTVNENIQLRKEMSLTECAGIFVAETRDLADTQIAKLQSLMENVAFSSTEEYREKLVAIKDNYLNGTPTAKVSRPAAQQINEEMTFSPVKLPESTTVESYASVIGKLNKKV